MSHRQSTTSVILALSLFIIAFLLLLFFYWKRKTSGIKALDYMIGIFLGVSIIAIFSIPEYYFHESWFIFGGKNPLSNASVPNLANIATLAQFILILYVYYVAESFLGQRPNLFRLSIISSLSGVFILLSTYFLLTRERIQTSQIFGKSVSNTSGLDSFVFDFLQIIVISLFAYVYVLQFKFTANKQVRKYILIILFAIFLYVIGSILEFLEHFGFPDIDGIIFAILTFLVLAVFYFRYPNFIYLTPANITFIQIVSKNGISLYKAEAGSLGNEEAAQLVGPALMAVNQLVNEFVSGNSKQQEFDNSIKSIGYNHGIILFETAGEIRAILETDRATAILRRSLRYFLEEFNRTFKSSLGETGGIIETSAQGVTPEDLFIKCIPIVSCKAIFSHYT